MLVFHLTETVSVELDTAKSIVFLGKVCFKAQFVEPLVAFSTLLPSVAVAAGTSTLCHGLNEIVKSII